jgi:2-polyprenyl-6-methoxyphenol hydroxylase-like FAD-dependent oxidoreductase
MQQPQTAIVVGAGMGGLAAAAALAPHFSSIAILDRDALADGHAPRPGVGQGAHIHQLLKGGEQSLESLLPGFRAALEVAGAVPMRVGLDIDLLDFGGLLKPVDAGFSVASMSRPAYESVLRERVRRLPNIELRDQTPVSRFSISDGRCVGVELEHGERLAADLVVDGSGVASPLAQQLMDEGHAAFETENIRINVAYTTGRFAIPERWRGEARGFFFLPAPPDAHFGLLLPVENNEWMVALGGRGAHAPPRDLDGFIAYASRMATPEIFERIREASLTLDLRTYRKAFATRRRLDQATRWPERLVPMGDAMSSVNPTYGQGMSVAALQAVELRKHLARRAASGEGLDGLVRDFVGPAFEIADRAWSLAINSDYAYPETEGERPANFAMSRNVAAVLRRLCDADPEFAIFRYRLAHMIETAAPLREGPLAIKFFTALQGSMAPAE